MEVQFNVQIYLACSAPEESSCMVRGLNLLFNFYLLYVEVAEYLINSSSRSCRYDSVVRPR